MAVGRIVGAHGLQGRLRVRLFDGVDPAAWPRVRVAEREDDGAAAGFEVASLEPGRPGELRVALEGVGSRDDAEALRGRLVLADTRDLEALEEGEYYGYQLVGCRVESTDGTTIGVVRDIWSTGAPDVLVVEDARGREQLIPAAASLLQQVDVEARRIVVEVVPGLLDAEADRPADEGSES